MPHTILIVDDNALIRGLVRSYIEQSADLRVCGEAENGQDGIRKARQLHPDLIVLDLSMPVMNGIDAAQILKKLMPRVPLIIFSEYSEVFSEKEARSVGISALISKSDHISVLVSNARELLEQSIRSTSLANACR
jgi:DNA-binding NarL/FixJ family response regulator